MGRRSLLSLKTLFLSALISLSPTAAQADISEEAAAIIAALKEQVDALVSRVETLESDQAKIRTETISAPKISSAQTASASPSWTDDFKITGDFRYRHEAFDVEDRVDRQRQRLRARVYMTGQVTDTIEAGFGLASGGSNPLSANQTFDNGNSSKSVVLNLAYVKWNPKENLNVFAGKFHNPLHRVGGNGLIWDDDLKPEGIGIKYKKGNVFVNALGSWVEENSSASDTILIGGQIGMDTDAGDGALKLGLGYYNYIDSEGMTPFFDGGARGNLLDASGGYWNGFELVEGFAEYGFGVSEGELTLFADYVQNLEADDYDTGYALGGIYKQNQWQFRYTYQDLEPDAVLGTFTDSNFIGGGTDGNGHILQTRYQLNSKIQLRGTLFLNDRNIDFGDEEEYKRLMLDIRFKY